MGTKDEHLSQTVRAKGYFQGIMSSQLRPKDKWYGAKKRKKKNSGIQSRSGVNKEFEALPDQDSGVLFPPLQRQPEASCILITP